MPGADTLKINDVVQIDPAHDPEMFGGCLMVVTEVKTWGLQGYVQIPGKKLAQAFYRVADGKYAWVGRAVWVDRDEDGVLFSDKAEKMVDAEYGADDPDAGDGEENEQH